MGAISWMLHRGTKTLENSQLDATTDATQMKLTSIMYLDKLFLLTRTWGITCRG